MQRGETKATRVIVKVKSGVLDHFDLRPSHLLLVMFNSETYSSILTKLESL